MLFECEVLGQPPRLWVFRNDRWALRSTATIPPSRRAAAFGWDPSRGVAVLFGGVTQYLPTTSTLLDDTWEYDGIDWRQILPTTRPPAQYAASLAYDPASRSMLLVRGTSLTTYSDCYRFDGLDWTSVGPLVPFLSHLVTLATDPARQRIVALADYAAANTTYEWDGAVWTTAGAGPAPGGCNRTLYYDHALAAVVAQGGTLADRHRWTGSAWTPLPSIQGPALGNQQIIDVPAAGLLLHVGGLGNSTVGTATHVYRAGAWTQIDHSLGWFLPELICHDPGRDVFVAFDRRARFGMAYNRTGFLRHDLPPLATRLEGLAYDPVRSRLVALGEAGAGNVRCWEHDGQQWLAGPLPPSGALGALAWHARMQRVVAKGNPTLLSYDGAAWTPFGTPVPSQGNSLIYDAARDRLLIPAAPQSGAWAVAEWDGSQWYTITPAQSPTSRFSATTQQAFAYDPVRQRTVAFGGRNYGPPNPGGPSWVFFNDLWEWDGATWSQRVLPNPPPGREGAALFHDPVANRLLVCSGNREEHNGAIRVFGDVWGVDSAPGGSVQALGRGCGALGLRLAADAPLPGNPDFAVGVQGALPQTLCLCLFGFANQSAVPVPGCTLFVPQPDAIAPLVTDWAGFAWARTRIPLAASGIQWSAQAVAWNAGAPELSDGVRIGVGY